MARHPVRAQGGCYESVRHVSKCRRRLWKAWGWVGAGTKRIRAHTCTTVLVEVEPSLGIYSICEFTVFGCDPSQAML